MYRLCMQLSLLLVNHTTYHQMCRNNFCRKTMDGSSDEIYHHPLMRKSRGHIHSIVSLVKSFLIFLEGSLFVRRGYSFKYPPYTLGYRHYSLLLHCQFCPMNAPLCGRVRARHLIAHCDNDYEHDILEFGILEL